MEAPARRLLILPISPWSERARWALDHHGLAYKTEIHTPLFGESRLRRLAGPARERATVPILRVGDQVLADSWDIAQYAEREGRGAPLLPPGLEPEIRRWTTLADELMGEGRALVTGAILSSPAALDETLPRAVPRWLRPLLRPVTRYVTAWFARKYRFSLDDLALSRERVRDRLVQIRAGLGGRATLLETFSYADIAVATSLQGVSPVNSPTIRLGPALRQAWTQPELAAEFADLIAWRDGLYAAHRGR